MSDTETIVLIIACIFLPPLAVYIKTKELGTDFLISLVLAIFLWFPSILFAAYVCFFRK